MPKVYNYVVKFMVTTKLQAGKSWSYNHTVNPGLREKVLNFGREYLTFIRKKYLHKTICLKQSKISLLAKIGN